MSKAYSDFMRTLDDPSYAPVVGSPVWWDAGGGLVVVPRFEGRHDEVYALELVAILDQRVPWAAAQAWAARLNTNLPNREELNAIYASIAPTARRIFAASWYWSSTTFSGFKSSAWAIDFASGTWSRGSKATRHFAFVVRRHREAETQAVFHEEQGD